jgi:hypothetical protein
MERDAHFKSLPLRILQTLIKEHFLRVPFTE